MSRLFNLPGWIQDVQKAAEVLERQWRAAAGSDGEPAAILHSDAAPGSPSARPGPMALQEGLGEPSAGAAQAPASPRLPRRAQAHPISSPINSPAE